MPQQTIQAVLQIVAVISILIGGIMASTAIVMMIGTNRMIADLPNNVSLDLRPMTSMGFLGIMGAAMPIYWGIGLLVASPAIATRIQGNQRGE